MKTARLRLLLAACIAMIAIPSQAQEIPDDRYRGGSFAIEFGGFVGTKVPKISGITFVVVGGYTFNKHLFAGGGIGLRNIVNDDFNDNLIPLFARVRYLLLESKIAPYISLDAGYNFGHIKTDFDYSYSGSNPWINEIKNGFYLHPELGISVQLVNRLSMYFGIGYDRQRAEVHRNTMVSGEQQTSKRRTSLNVISFRTGFLW